MIIGPVLYPAKGTAIKDLKKAKQYIDMLIELKEEQNQGTKQYIEMLVELKEEQNHGTR